MHLGRSCEALAAMGISGFSNMLHVHRERAAQGTSSWARWAAVFLLGPGGAVSPRSADGRRRLQRWGCDVIPLSILIRPARLEFDQQLRDFIHQRTRPAMKQRVAGSSTAARASRG
jgi:hypothetical protein